MLLSIAVPIQQPRMRFFNAQNKPLVGGKVYSFKIGTDLFKPTFRNASKTALNQNPVVLDEAGSALIYMTGSHLLKIFDKLGSLVELRYLPMTETRTYFYDKYGKPLKNGKVWTYDIASTIKKKSYSVPDKTELNPNPVILDENGSAVICMVGSYRLRIHDSKDVFQEDQDFQREPAFALTSKPYPLYLDEDITAGFRSEDLDRYDITWKESALNDHATANLSLSNVFMRDSSPIPHIEQVNCGFSLANVLLSQPPKYDIKEDVTVGLLLSNVIYRIPISTNIQEQVSASILLNSVVVEYL